MRVARWLKKNSHYLYEVKLGLGPGEKFVGCSTPKCAPSTRLGSAPRGEGPQTRGWGLFDHPLPQASRESYGRYYLDPGRPPLSLDGGGGHGLPEGPELLLGHDLEQLALPAGHLVELQVGGKRRDVAGSVPVGRSGWPLVNESTGGHGGLKGVLRLPEGRDGPTPPLLLKGGHHGLSPALSLEGRHARVVRLTLLHLGVAVSQLLHEEARGPVVARHLRERENKDVLLVRLGDEAGSY